MISSRVRAHENYVQGRQAVSVQQGTASIAYDAEHGWLRCSEFGAGDLMLAQDALDKLKAGCVAISTPTSIGTGFIASHGLIVTCAHVLDGAAPSEVKFRLDGTSEWLPVQDLRADPDTDVAILFVSQAIGARSLTLSSSATVSNNWDSYMFPAFAESAGFPLDGQVTDWKAVDPDGKAAISLLAPMLGSKPELGGASGSPVMVDGHVVAMLYRVLGKEGERQVPQVGLVYAYPFRLLPNEFKELLGIADAAPVVAPTNEEPDIKGSLEHYLPELVRTPWVTPTKGRVVGDYELVENLGYGRFAEVWKARHRHSNSMHALKIFTPHSFPDEDREEAARRFCRGAVVMHRLQRVRSIVRIFAGPTFNESYIWFSMELYDSDLAKRLTSSPPLTAAERASVIDSVLDALHGAHAEQITHRDVRPSNILVRRTADGTLESVLSDFDIAYYELMFKGRTTEEALGHPRYQPPDLLKIASTNRAEITARLRRPSMDLYALSVVVYDLFVGPDLTVPSMPLSPKQYGEELDAASQRNSLPIPRQLQRSASAVLAHGLAPHEKDAFATTIEFRRAWRWSRKVTIAATFAATCSMFLVATALFVLTDFLYCEASVLYGVSLPPATRGLWALAPALGGAGFLVALTRVLITDVTRAWPGAVRQRLNSWLLSSWARRFLVLVVSAGVLVTALAGTHAIRRLDQTVIETPANCEMENAKGEKLRIPPRPSVFARNELFGLECFPSGGSYFHAASILSSGRPDDSARNVDLASLEDTGGSDADPPPAPPEDNPRASGLTKISCDQLALRDDLLDWTAFVEAESCRAIGEWHRLLLQPGHDGASVFVDSDYCGTVRFDVSSECVWGIRFQTPQKFELRDERWNTVGTLKVVASTRAAGCAIAATRTGFSEPIAIGTATGSPLVKDLPPAQYDVALMRSDKKLCTSTVTVKGLATSLVNLDCPCAP